jgi:phage shock protein A
MSVIRKLCTLARGTARESAQVVLDANAQRVFEQEILDVEKAIQKQKHALSEVIASRKQVKSEAEAIQTLIEKRECQAQRLIKENKDDDLVEDIAKEIVDHEMALETLETQRAAIEKRIHNMECSLHKALRNVANYRRDLRMASVQQLSASCQAKTSSLPQQLSELEATRTHLVSLQTLDDEQDEAWVEMEERVGSGNIDSRLDRIGESEKHAHFTEVLERLRHPDQGVLTRLS